MPEWKDHIDELITKYLQGSLSVLEEANLNEWINESSINKELFEKLTNKQWVSGELEKMYGYDEEKGWNKIKGNFPFQTTQVIDTEAPNQGASIRRLFPWKRIAVAASIITVLGLATYLFLNKPTQQTAIVKAPVLNNDVAAPAGNRAMITLANGQKVFLDSVANGNLVTQGNVKVVKTADGKIVYEGSSPAPVGEDRAEVFNTLTNPRGSLVIDITLADGSRVWLNAGSSLTYPISFVGNQRKVDISGEAYFEIAHNPNKPFIVNNGETRVEVLGTHFNVNAYDDEPNTKVTLLEGSVKVSGGTSPSPLERAEVRLKPGEQAQIAGNIKVVKGIDTDAVMAWKNGLFDFNNTDIKDIMRQAARWYDVEVAYEGTISSEKFKGTVARTTNLVDLMKILQLSGVKYRIEGTKLIVTQ